MSDAVVAQGLVKRYGEVTALDNFDSFYSAASKRSNLALAMESPRFRLVEGDIRDEARARPPRSAS